MKNMKNGPFFKALVTLEQYYLSLEEVFDIQMGLSQMRSGRSHVPFLDLMHQVFRVVNIVQIVFAVVGSVHFSDFLEAFPEKLGYGLPVFQVQVAQDLELLKIIMDDFALRFFPVFLDVFLPGLCHQLGVLNLGLLQQPIPYQFLGEGL
jgi:hypothetical protein